MRKMLLAAVAALATSAGPALSADLVTKARPAPAAAPASIFDIAFGGIVQSDYNFRGVSQSNRGISGGAYFEPQLTLPFGTLYVGLAAWGINWPSSPAFGFTDPSAEVNYYGGWRNTFGILSVDLGGIYYHYPREQFNGFTGDSDFWEVYAKLSAAITPDFTIGANVFYTPDLLNYSESFGSVGVSSKAAATYGSLTAKWVLPFKHGDLGAFVSGELGHWWIRDSGFRAFGVATGLNIGDPSYTYFNAGLAFTYKAITLDLRYHGNDMNDADCGSFLITGSPHQSNKWCGNTFIAGLKFDTTLSSLR
jgi:uncharacterized protein (TIGR02001 family)